MTKKDYERAATIAQSWKNQSGCGGAVVMAFIELFTNDNPHFDEARFRAACVPGADVRARPPKAD